MSFLNPTTTFTRIRIQPSCPEDMWDAIREDGAQRLLRFAFNPIDQIPESESWGWTSFHSKFNLDWKDEDPALEFRFLRFGLRGDVRRIPYETMMAGVHSAIEAEKERNKFISRDRKAELREQTRLRLLGRIPPTPSWYQVLWDNDRQEIWLTTNQAKQIETFQNLFERTFGLKTVQLDWYEMAGENRDMIDSTGPVGHAGCEFLLWLWFVSEQGYRIRGSQEQSGSIHVSGGVTLTSHEGSLAVSQNIEEAWMGVTKGKTPTSMRLALSLLDWDYQVTLRSDMTFTSAKTPKVVVAQDDDPDTALLEKIILLQNLVDSIDHAYSDFIMIRTDEDRWGDTWNQIMGWSHNRVFNSLGQ